ncbi:hypothetical protein AVEN_163276-1, partial [Araneus ventricosus]
MLATKAAICVCGQLIVLCIGFMLASESKNSLHQGHEEERDSSHMLCLLWGILCGRRDDSTVVDSKPIEVKCESKLCSFWHTFSNKKNAAIFYNSLQSSSSVKIPNKHGGLSYQEWRIANSTKEKIPTKNLNNSSVSNRIKFNRVGMPYRVPDSLSYYFHTHFASRTLKQHLIDDSLNKATNFFTPNEKYAKQHLINADTYNNVASMENDTDLMFSAPESYNYNESVIPLSLTKDKFSKEQLSYADEEMNTMPKSGSVNESAIHNSAFNAQINFTDTKPFSKIDATTSKSDDGATKSNLLNLSSSEINFPRFPKASYIKSSDAENNKAVFFGANVEDFKRNSSKNSPNDTSLNEIASRREGTFGNDTNLQKENTFTLTNKLNGDYNRTNNAPEFEFGILENSKKLNDTYSFLTTETETIVTKDENSYAAASYDSSSTRIENRSLENSILAGIKSGESIQNIRNHENNINELNLTNISLNKPERNSVSTNNNNTEFPFNSDKSEANSRINNDEINVNIEELNATNIQRQYIFERNFDNNDSKTTKNYSRTSNSSKQPLSVEKHVSDRVRPEMFDSGIDNFRIPRNAQLNSSEYPMPDIISKELKDKHNNLRRRTGVTVSYNPSIATHSNETDESQSVKPNFNQDDSTSHKRTSTFPLNFFSKNENYFDVTETPQDLFDKKIENSKNPTTFFNKEREGIKLPLEQLPSQVNDIQSNGKVDDREAIAHDGNKNVNLNITDESEEGNTSASVKEEYLDHDFTEKIHAVANQGILKVGQTVFSVAVPFKYSTENSNEQLTHNPLLTLYYNTPSIDMLNISTVKQVQLYGNNNLDNKTLAETSHLNQNIMLDVPPDITSTKRSLLFQSDLLKSLFPIVSANVSQDSDKEKVSQNAKFSTKESSKINSNTDAMYPANSAFSGFFTLSMPSSQNRKDKEFQMAKIGISVANENQSFTSAYEDLQT